MKIRILILMLAVMIFGSAAAHAQRTSAYIGYEYKGVNPSKRLPNGVVSLGGGLIGDIDADPVYEIANVEKGKTKMLWLNVSTGQNSTGVTGWKVLDVLSFVNLTRRDYIFFADDPSVACTKAGRAIENLAGVGRFVPRSSVFRPSKLWTANLATKKFEPVALTGVKCEYSEP